MSKEKQEQLGLKTAAEVYKQMPVLPDSDPVTRYVQQLGGKLLGVIPRQETWPYQFHVVQQSDINAFALPGGPIFVNVGTISAAENEAELAVCWRTKCRMCTCSIQPNKHQSVSGQVC